MENNEEKYYTSSDGTKTLLKDVHSEHLINGFAKKIKNVFESQTKDEFVNKMTEINNIKEEIYKRINDFSSNLKDDDINGQ